MNIQQDILLSIYNNGFTNQRELAKVNKCSLGLVNQSLKKLIEKQLIDKNHQLTDNAINYIKSHKTKRAIILAAGYGMRMVPINTETPKGLLKVHGEYLIERQIEQLHKVGINEIYVVVGFMKESYEYLIDKYNVKLIVNKDYSIKNNIYSLYLAKEHLSDAYIIPCDIYMKDNILNEFELYSWYMVKDRVCDHSDVKVNRNNELIRIKDNEEGNNMVGISYIGKEDANLLKNNLEKLIKNGNYESFWEEALYSKNKMIISARVINFYDVYEINTYEQLRTIDSNSRQLRSNVINEIKEALNVKENDIKDITTLKKGMTNRSFLFTCKNHKYIMRIPGEGTDKLINRKEEADVYQMIKDNKLCDDIIYINPNNGYKITKFLDNTRNCDANNIDDITKCMDFLRSFHDLRLKVNHYFNIFDKIDFYESLWGENVSMYRDYKETKSNVLKLKKYIDAHKGEMYLTHIDAVADNFLIFKNDDNKEEIRLIDWEYAAMQDQDVDIAMFAIYSLYNKEQVDQLIDIYYKFNCNKETRIKIYCYIACCGLLWSNWCEYKHLLGVEFGEYSLCQYRYAKEYYRYVIKEIGEL